MNLRAHFRSNAKGSIGTRFAANMDGSITTTIGGGRLSDAALAMNEIRGIAPQAFSPAGMTL